MSTSEFEIKQQRIADLLEQQQLNGLLLCRSSSWSWASCGHEANVAINSESAVSALLFTKQRAYLLANQIEMPRLLAEEVGSLPFEPVEYAWHTADERDRLAFQLANGPLASDLPLPGMRDLSDELATMRAQLTTAEQVRFRQLGAITGAALEAAARAIQPGMSEYAIAGVVATETYQRAATPVVTLIAVDDRIKRFRHPSASSQTLEHYAMLVLCARRFGLVASATRLVSFGPMADELQHRAVACAKIDALLHAATQPGRTLGAIFADLQAAYTAAGFADEWQLHHQGGPAGYENREAIATPNHPFVVQAGQAYAWNPSITGVKSEDTILISDHGYEVITATNAWPSYPVTINGTTVNRPAILER
jgi:antitoxin VapB